MQTITWGGTRPAFDLSWSKWHRNCVLIGFKNTALLSAIEIPNDRPDLAQSVSSAVYLCAVACDPVFWFPSTSRPSTILNMRAFYSSPLGKYFNPLRTCSDVCSFVWTGQWTQFTGLKARDCGLSQQFLRAAWPWMWHHACFSVSTEILEEASVSFIRVDHHTDLHLRFNVILLN